MDVLYSVMQGLESRLGGGEGVEGIYGSVTASGMHKILECMRHNCGLGSNSTLVDIGAGLGRPLLHALLLHRVAYAYGVELDRVKVAKADAFCRGVISELTARGILCDSSTDSSGAKAGAAAAATSPSAPAAACARACDGAPTTAAVSGCAAGSAAADRDGRQDSSEGVFWEQLPDVVLASQGSCPGSQGDAPVVAAAAAAAAVHCDKTVALAESSPNGTDAAGPPGCSSEQRLPAAAQQQQQQQQQQLQHTSAVGPVRTCSRLKQGKGQQLPWPASRPIITCAAIEQVASLDPCTHAYSFWEGVPLDGKQGFGRLFRTSKTLRAVAVVQRAMRGVAPEAVMAQLGFGPLLLIKAFPVNMSGSGRSFTAYVFSKVAPPAAALLMRHSTALGSSCLPHKQQQQCDRDVAASSSKPSQGSKLHPSSHKKQPAGAGIAVVGAAGADTEDGSGAAAADAGSTPDQQQQQRLRLVQLLTEQSLAVLNQQQLCSPAKRAQPFLQSVAAAAAEVDEGSPSKKQRGLQDIAADQQGAAAAAAAAAADVDAGLVRCGSGGYGLRPRQLSYSTSSSKGGSSRSSSMVTTGPASAAAGPAAAAAASGGGGGCVHTSVRSGLRNSSGGSSSMTSRAQSMSVDQPQAGRGGSKTSSRAAAPRTTAVSGGRRGNARGEGQQQQHQQQQQRGAGVAGTGVKIGAAMGSGKRHVGARRATAGSSVSAVVSDARAAVAALDV